MGTTRQIASQAFPALVINIITLQMVWASTCATTRTASASVVRVRGMIDDRAVRRYIEGELRSMSQCATGRRSGKAMGGPCSSLESAETWAIACQGHSQACVLAVVVHELDFERVLTTFEKVFAPVLRA